jgi:hypothetical protein
MQKARVKAIKRHIKAAMHKTQSGRPICHLTESVLFVNSPEIKF